MAHKISLDPRADFKNYREALRQMVEGGLTLPRDLMPSPLNAVVVPVDVLDNGTEVVVKASLPGVAPEDVVISVLKNTLTIRAETREDNDIRGATYLRRERKTLTYIRTLTLPIAVNAEKSEAKFKNGVLTLTLPKSESLRPRTIRADSE